MRLVSRVARRWWTFTPRRCAVCRQWLSRSRWQLGLSVCSGACNRKRNERGCGCRPQDFMGLHGLTCPFRRPDAEGFPKHENGSKEAGEPHV